MRRTVIARSAKEIERLQSAWEKFPPPTIFQTFAWNQAAAQVFAEREQPHVILVENDNGSALIPAAIADSRLTFLGEFLTDYRNVLSAGDPNALESAWANAADLGLNISTGAVRADSDMARWEGFTVTPYYRAPLVSREKLSPDGFLAEHNRLGRWKRRLEREGVQFRSYTGANSDLIRRIYREKGSRPAESGPCLFSDPVRVDFMVQVCAALGSACEIFTLESGGTLVASLVTFREPSIRRFYTIQFNQVWAKYSPGMVLIYQITYDSLRNGLDCDYMTGEQGYKMRFATSVVPMFWVKACPQVLRSLSKRQEIAA